jgi:hypothetical protein
MMSGAFRPDAYVVEFDTSGNPIWAKCSIGNTICYGLAIDNSNSIYMTGSIDDTSINFGTYSFSNPNLYWGGFIIKYDTSGNTLWGKSFYPLTSHTSGSFGVPIYEATIDPCNNIWVSGNIPHDSIGLEGGVLFHTPSIGTDPMLLAGFNSSGSLLQYLTLHSGGDDNAGMTTDCNGNVYIAGDIDTARMIIGSDTIFRYSGGENMFAAKYNPHLGCSGICSSSAVSQIEGHASFCFGITTDTLSDATIGGVWSSSNTSIATVGTSTGIVTGVSLGVVTITYTVGSNYVTMIDTVKWCEGGVSLVGNKGNQIMMYPNPTSTQLTISSSDRITNVVITNMVGQMVYSQLYSAQQIQVNVADLPKGVYFVKVNCSLSGLTTTGKFVKE